jgi:hypothetical protein
VRIAIPALGETEDADHGFGVPARTRRRAADVMDDLAGRTARWIAPLAARKP